jgi:tryptophan-rich sensory protein
MKFKVLLHTLLPILAAIIINIVIYTQGWNNNGGENKEISKLLPPGYIIAIVWIIILGLLGYVHYLTFPSYISVFILIVIIYCLSYPFLTAGLKEDKGDIYNILAFAMAIIVSIIIWLYNKKVVLYTLPFLIWTTYVAVVTLVKYSK